MRMSSSFDERIVGLPALEHGPDDGDTAPREGDEGLVVVLSLAALAVVEGLGERVLGRRRRRRRSGRRRALRALVAAIGAPPARAFAGTGAEPARGRRRKPAHRPSRSAGCRRCRR